MSRLAFALLIVVAACSRAGPRFDGTHYRDARVAFRVDGVPPGWRQLTIRDAALAFRDEAHDASVLVNASCAEKGADVPLLALMNHLLAGTTERVFSFDEVVPFDGREALHARLTAKLDGVPMAYEVFVLKKDGCVFDFVYVGAPAQSAAGAPAFESFVKSFRKEAT